MLVALPVLFLIAVNGQYNILAGYLGENMQPWFMYGIDVPAERRGRIIAKFYQKDEQGRYMNAGWPKYVQGILTEEEIQQVKHTVIYTDRVIQTE